MINDLVKENERVDDLQNGYYIIQDPRKFCFGMDAVLLSGFARVKKGEKVLDMGTGTGIIPVLLASKTVGEHFTGLEIQEEEGILQFQVVHADSPCLASQDGLDDLPHGLQKLSEGDAAAQVVDDPNLLGNGKAQLDAAEG